MVGKGLIFREFGPFLDIWGDYNSPVTSKDKSGFIYIFAPGYMGRFTQFHEPSLNVVNIPAWNHSLGYIGILGLNNTVIKVNNHNIFPFITKPGLYELVNVSKIITRSGPFMVIDYEVRNGNVEHISVPQ